MSEHESDGHVARIRLPARGLSGMTQVGMSPPVATRVPRDASSCRFGDAACAVTHARALDRSIARIDRRAMHDTLLDLQRRYGNQFVGQVLDLARDGTGAGLDAVETSITQARGGGHGLDHRTSEQMNSAFGANFSSVRIHADARADQLSHALSARAFATGNDIFFRQGEYDPGSASGRELLAHELTHVVQQSGTGLNRKMTVSQPDDPHEVEADHMARLVMQQEHRPSPARKVMARAHDEGADVSARLVGNSVQLQPEAPRLDEDDKQKVHKSAMSSETLAREAEDDPSS